MGTSTLGLSTMGPSRTLYDEALYYGTPNDGTLYIRIVTYGILYYGAP